MLNKLRVFQQHFKQIIALKPRQSWKHSYLLDVE